MPALLVVLFAVYVLGLMLLLPKDMVDLSKSLLAAAASASDVYFWFGAGYFDRMSISKPLLHTWSLAVEEQFYVAWPIFLIIGYRFFRRHLLAVLALVSLCSLGLSAAGVQRFPEATFYLPFTRFWELSLGGLLALGAGPGTLNPLPRNILAAVGLGLIGGSMLLIDPVMRFPGLAALPVCIGAAILLLAGRHGETWVGRLLSIRPMVFVGLISYSLYLWHWPITVFQRNCAFLGGGLAELQTKFLIFGASLLAATLSWRFVETPFREGKKRPSAGQLFRIAAAGTAALLVLGSIAWTAQGFPSRYSARELRAASFIGYDSSDEFRFGRCFLSAPLKEWRLDPACLALSPSKRNYLILGDSHAAELWYGLNATYRDANFLQVTAADCLPTIKHNSQESSRCTDIMDVVYKDFLAEHSVDGVFLSARWSPTALGNVRDTLQWMAQHRIHVTLFGPTAIYDSPVPRLLVSAMRASDPALPQHHRDESIRSLDTQMRVLAKTQGVAYVSMIALLCTKSSCALEDDSGLPMIYDGEHFTEGGSAFVAKRLFGVVTSMRGDKVKALLQME